MFTASYMMPPRPPSVMQTWSTMNRLMSRASVHVRLTFSRSAKAINWLLERLGISKYQMTIILLFERFCIEIRTRS